MSENKTSKYFKYAIGEILLVVIGILIALQVNNWNEQRKKNWEIDNLVESFKDELQSNIKTSSILIDVGYNRDSILTLYLDDLLTEEYLLENGNWGLGFGTSTQYFISDNLDEFIDIERDLPKYLKELAPDFKELKRRIESQRFWEQKAIETSMAYRKELSDTYPWYNQPGSESEYIDLVLKDPLYKNKVVYYNEIQLDENIWDASLIRTSSIDILWKIRNLTEDEAPNMDEFLRELELVPFKQWECNETAFKIDDPTYLRLGFIMFNNTDHPVEYNFINPDGESFFRKNQMLEPKSFLLDEFSHRSAWLIKTFNDPDCKKVYGKSREDYIVISND